MSAGLRSRVAQDFWDLIALFFQARRLFRETHDLYEKRVLGYAEQFGVDRRLLRLGHKEVAGLLDFKRLEALRDADLYALKTVSHNIFRNAERTDRFDRFVSQIYHDLSILKEEQYKVATFAPELERANEKGEMQAILDEVHEAFPRSVHGINELFDKAQTRLEELLPVFVSGPKGKVTIRSLYLFGEETFDGFYVNGLEDVYEVIYRGGAVEGFAAVGRSFHESGFREYAIEALEKAVRAPAPQPPPAFALPGLEAAAVAAGWDSTAAPAIAAAPAPAPTSAAAPTSAPGAGAGPAPAPAPSAGVAAPDGGTVTPWSRAPGLGTWEERRVRAEEKRREAEELLRELREAPKGRKPAAPAPTPRTAQPVGAGAEGARP